MALEVLFVDDESNVLSGLRRMLRSQRASWNMEFASSGQDAIALMKDKAFDVVVSDMRMPNMNGAELLTRVSETQPKCVRLILSGQSEQEKILRSVGPAHQFMSKPCDPDLLIRTINRTCSLQEHLRDESVRSIVNRITFLPSLPEQYLELVSELDSDESSIDRVSEIILRDIGMSAKVLQLVNSSFFGLARQVRCPKHAVSLLGLNIMRPIVLLAGVVNALDDQPIPRLYSLPSTVSHCLEVACLAKRIAASLGMSGNFLEETFTAGMLHDLGKIILANSKHDSYEQVLEAAKSTDRNAWEVELEYFGTTHAEIGAHLLNLWGICNQIVEAVAFHHRPMITAPNQFSPLTAVHIANGLLPSAHPSNESSQYSRICFPYLEEIGISTDLTEFEKIRDRSLIRI